MTATQEAPRPRRSLDQIKATYPHSVESHSFTRYVKEGKLSLVETGKTTSTIYRNPETGRIAHVANIAIDSQTVVRTEGKPAPPSET